MKISVIAKPSSREEKIEKLNEGNFVVSVKAPPVKGKANLAIIKALAEYFKIPKSDISLVSGHFSRKKIIEIDL